MAGTGGKRPGAGRKLGSKNKKVEKEHVVRAKKSGLMPVEYMLEVMRDKNEETNVRMDAAKAAAPYFTPKLGPKAVDDNGSPGDRKTRAVEVFSDAFLTLIDKLPD